VQVVVWFVRFDAAPGHCNSHASVCPGGGGGGAGRESFSREDLTEFLDTFFPGMLTVKEIRTLVGPNGMKVERLRKLLFDNDLPETFDPAQEAFKVCVCERESRVLPLAEPVHRRMAHRCQSAVSFGCGVIDEADGSSEQLERRVNCSGYRTPAHRRFGLFLSLSQELAWAPAGTQASSDIASRGCSARCGAAEGGMCVCAAGVAGV